MKKDLHSDRRFAEHVNKHDCRNNNRFRLTIILVAIVLSVLVGITAIRFINKEKDGIHENQFRETIASIEKPEIDLFDLPVYSGIPFYELNSGRPFFDIDHIDVSTAFETYSELDDLGRCGSAFANLCRELMPVEPRGDIGMIKPTGWHTVKYPELIDDLYLYNRCHLIAFSLAGENANERNLITGTRYFNVEGMLPFENLVRQYIEDTGNHVLYRVTPIFDGRDLVARGVLMEAFSVEDHGDGICFNVFVYNVQPGIAIDYSDGNSVIDN